MSTRCYIVGFGCNLSALFDFINFKTSFDFSKSTAIYEEIALHSKMIKGEDSLEEVEYNESQSDVTVRLGSVLLMDDQQRVLLVLSRYGHQWKLPETEIRCGESPLQSVRRFLFDDFGVRVNVKGCLNVDYSINRNDGLDKMRTTFFATLASPPADLISCISPEVGEYRFVTPEELDSFPSELGLYRMMTVMARQQQFLPLEPEDEQELYQELH